MNLRRLINELISLIETMGISVEKYPDEAEEHFQIAIKQKREGKYFESLVTYSNLICDYFPAYSGILNGLYKTIACAGYLKEARRLLVMCNKEASRWFGYNNNFRDHMNRLDASIKNLTSLIGYLMKILGNLAYSLPRSYKTIYEEYYNL